MSDDNTSSSDDEEDAAVPHVPLRELDKNMRQLYAFNQLMNQP
jgi:hypothetical protein